MAVVAEGGGYEEMMAMMMTRERVREREREGGEKRKRKGEQEELVGRKKERPLECRRNEAQTGDADGSGARSWRDWLTSEDQSSQPISSALRL